MGERLTKVACVAYYAPTARRRFFTAKAACNAEAAALIKRKYPTEAQETDEVGRVTFGGWHWSGDERLVRVHDRLARRLRRSLTGVRK